VLLLLTGLAVSLPLLRVGYSRSKSFWYGQLSGMVEPIGGVLGAFLITFMQPLLPYALSFAAGAMIFVVVEDLIPETRSPGGFPTLASGFVMMSMDVGLG
jgi:zinc transporter ZupT